MKLKQSPEDFSVEELTDVVPQPSGAFSLYRLAKSGWTTPDAISIIRQRWHISPQRISFGGLKDRHANTTQFITIENGPKKNLEHQRMLVTFLGHAHEPFTSDQIRDNRFAITVRELSATAVKAMEFTIKEVRTVGLPNYFDDQRFGSVIHGTTFLAMEMMHARFESALRLALTAPYEFDRASQKREKSMLNRHWGDWQACRQQCGKGSSRYAIDHLCANPTDFRGAIERLNMELQGLYLAAYQSHVWNRTLAKWIEDKTPAKDRVDIETRLGSLPVPRTKIDWNDLVLPLPSARWKPEPDSPWLPYVEGVLAEDGLTLATMKVPGMHKPFFSKGDRPVCLKPKDITMEHDVDDQHLGLRKAILHFDLIRGSYATMVVKRLSLRTKH